MELKDQLKSEGIAKGLCLAFQRKLDQCGSVADMAALFVQGIDFCVSNDYPTLDFMRKYRGKCEPYGIFIDDDVDVSDMQDVVLNGKCRAFLSYGGYTVARVVARHDTQGAVNVSDYAHVTIDALDNSALTVAVAGSCAKVLVNVYGDAQIKCIGSGIQVINKLKKTY